MPLSLDAAIFSAIGVIVTGGAALIYNYSRGQADKKTSDAAMLTADTLSRRADTDARAAQSASDTKWGESLVGTLTALTASYNSANTNASQWADRYAAIVHNLSEKEAEMSGLKTKTATLEYEIAQERELRRRSDEKRVLMENEAGVRDTKIKEQAVVILTLTDDNRLLKQAQLGTINLVTKMAEVRIPSGISDKTAAQVQELVDLEKRKAAAAVLSQVFPPVPGVENRGVSGNSFPDSLSSAGQPGSPTLGQPDSPTVLNIVEPGSPSVGSRGDTLAISKLVPPKAGEATVPEAVGDREPGSPSAPLLGNPSPAFMNIFPAHGNTFPTVGMVGFPAFGSTFPAFGNTFLILENTFAALGNTFPILGGGGFHCGHGHEITD